MSSAIIGMYGVYLVLVAYQGNSAQFLSDLAAEKNFVPWIVVILVLASLESNSTTHKFVAPFAALAIISFVVTKFPTVKQDVSQTYDYLTGKGTAVPAVS